MLGGTQIAPARLTQWCQLVQGLRARYLSDDFAADGRFLVDRRYRRQGATDLAITGALEHIAAADGGTVESSPHNLMHTTKKMSSSFLYLGRGSGGR